MGKGGSKDVSRQVILHVLFRVGIKGGVVGVRVILHLIWCDGSGQLKYHYHPLWDQLDRYTSDLLCLDSCRPPDATTTPKLTVVCTPLVMSGWASALRAHPDQAFVHYVIEGLSRSFRIGFGTVISHQHLRTCIPPICNPRSSQVTVAGRFLCDVCWGHSSPRL